MKQRDTSLDALRGIAILAMVFSGSITYADVLPAWMYHAQVPPPNHKFIETIAGITWVDLVFPFFLFSMGASIPLALSKQLEDNSNFGEILLIATRRFAFLAFFALFTEHMKPWVLSATPAFKDYVLSISGFVLIFFQLYNYKGSNYPKLFLYCKIAAFAVALLLLYLLPFGGKGFQLSKSDIIIIVLANMAFFGTIIWWLTKTNPWIRVGILPFMFAIFLAAKEPVNDWQKVVYNFSQIGSWNFEWLYRFYFLKYLFIIIPGTFAGEWLLQNKGKGSCAELNKATLLYAGLLSFTLVISNTVFLFSRQLITNFFLTIILLASLHFVFKKVKNVGYQLLVQFFNAGTYLLLLGLFFEAYEGGIKKDHSTYSYYFVTSGLAFFMLIFFSCIGPLKIGNSINKYLSLNGRNPMVAYVAGSLLIIPLLHIANAITLLDSMNGNAMWGVLKGVVFVGLVSFVTIIFTQKKWFWKT